MNKLLAISKNFKDDIKNINSKILIAQLEFSADCRFTVRESAILLKLASGSTLKQIAWECQLSIHTVTSHVANIKEKLKCSNSFQLALVLGLILAGYQLAPATG